MIKKGFFSFVFIMVLFSFAGCRQHQEKVVLRFSDWHLTENVWKKSLLEAVAEFQVRYPHIEIILEPVPYEDKDFFYITESEAGMAPDIYHLHANSLQYFFSSGYTKDLSAFIQSEGGSVFLKNWYDLPLKACMYQGQQMAMPGDFMSMVLVYNKECFEDAGLDPEKPPTDWDEFIKINRKLTIDSDGDGYTDRWGLTMIGAKDPGFELRFSPFIWAFGGDYLTPDLKHSALNRPETLRGFKYYVELAQKEKVVTPGVLKNTPQMSRMQLANEQAAMIVGSGWTIPIVDDFNPELNAHEVLEMAPLPVFEKPVTSAWLSAWVMNANTKHPEEAWELMKFITSREMELKWFKDNHVLSSRKDVSSTAPEILNDKFAAVISSQLPNARLVPQVRQWPEIIQVISRAAYDAINETKTPEEALQDAHLKVEAILNRKDPSQ